MNVTLHFYVFFFRFFTYTSTKNIIEQVQNASKSFFSVIIVSILNKDHGLIKKKWLEKVQHIESANRYIHEPFLALTDGPLYISGEALQE